MKANEKRQRGSGRVFMRGSVAWIQFQYHGQAVRMSTKQADPKKAEKILRKKLGEVEAGIHSDASRITYESLRDSLLTDFEVNARKSLRHDGEGRVYIDCVERLNTFFEGFKVNEIHGDAVRRFQADQRAKGLANATINRSVSALRRMLNLARREGKLHSVPYLPMLREAPPRDGFIERPAFDRLLSALPDYLRPVVALGWTGMRKSEVLNLKWDQVDFIANQIRLRSGETKNDQPRVIPLTAALAALLLERRGKRQGCVYVCFRVNRVGRVEQITNFRKAWQSVCCKLGLGKMEPADGTEIRKDRPRGKPRQKMVYNGLLFHDLRRSAVRNLVNSGVPEKTAMEISGHLTRSVFDRYNIVSEANVMEAGRRLESYLDSLRDNSGTEVHQNAASSKLVQ